MIMRPRGWGGVRQLGEQTFELYFQVAGNRQVEYAGNEQAAIERLDAVYEQRAAGGDQHLIGYPFERLAADWLAAKSRSARPVLSQTLAGYRDIIHNHF